MMRAGEQRRDQRLLWVGVGVVVVVVGLFAFLTGLYSNGTATPSPAYYAPFFPIGFPWVGGIFSLFFLFWAVSWFFRPWGWGWGYRRRYGWWRYDGASQILRERYAKGEISKEQFDQMMRDLEMHG